MVFNNPEVLILWREAWMEKEEALRGRYAKTLESLDEHSHALQPLRPGDHVMVQNQTGRFPKRWDKSGTVVETKNNEQYVVKMAGSGRLTLRNRRFLRKYTLALTPSSSQTVSATPFVPSVSSPVSENDQPEPLAIEIPQQASPQSRGQVLLPSTPIAPSRDNARTLPSQISRQLPPSRCTPTDATPNQSQLTFEDHDEPASLPLGVFTQPAPPLHASSRVRSQRTVYDASIGQYKEPSSVLDDV